MFLGQVESPFAQSNVPKQDAIAKVPAEQNVVFPIPSERANNDDNDDNVDNVDVADGAWEDRPANPNGYCICVVTVNRFS